MGETGTSCRSAPYLTRTLISGGGGLGGGEHVGVIPAMWRDDVPGEAVEDEHLSADQWERLFAGHDELGKVLLEEYGLKQEFHSHADAHA